MQTVQQRNNGAGPSTGVYLGSAVPIPRQQGSHTSTSSSKSNNINTNTNATSSSTSAAKGGVKKWKNKLKTFLHNAPTANAAVPSTSSTRQSGNIKSDSSSHQHASGDQTITSEASDSVSSGGTLTPASAALSNTLSTGSSKSVTPRPPSPTTTNNTPAPYSSNSNYTSFHASAPSSNNPFATSFQDDSTPQPEASTSKLPSSTQQIDGPADITVPDDIYAGYDISVYSTGGRRNPAMTQEDDRGEGGANDSYEARLSRLVGDLEDVDYGAFTHIGNDSENDGIGGKDDSRDIRISRSLFKDINGELGDMTLSNHPFAYVSAGTPSHLENSQGSNSAGLNGTKSAFGASIFLTSSLNFGNSQYNTSNLNIEDTLASFNTPLFDDFSAYTNLEDDDTSLNNIPVPVTAAVAPVEGIMVRTPSSSCSLPLSTIPSAHSDASGKSTAATSEMLTFSDKSRRSTASGSVDAPLSSAPFTMSSSMSQDHITQSDRTLFQFDGFNSLQSMFGTNADHLPGPAGSSLQANFKSVKDNEDHENEDEEDDFSKLLRESRIDGYAEGREQTSSVESHGTERPVDNITNSLMPSLPSEPASLLSSFDLSMFPTPKPPTSSVKMGSQVSTGSESSTGPSPSLSYGGSSTSNTSFDDPNAAKDSMSITTTPKKAKPSKRNSKNLSLVSIETLPISHAALVHTPTHSPQGSLSSIPPTPGSYKTATSVPTSPYRHRPIIHASALAWRVPPPSMSPQSSITVDTARTIRPSASQNFVPSDPFTASTSPVSRLSKLNTASSPELKRRRHIADDDEFEIPSMPSVPSGLDGRVMAAVENLPTASPQRPIAGRRRVAGRMSIPSLHSHAQNQKQQMAPDLHQRQRSQPLPLQSYSQQQMGQAPTPNGSVSSVMWAGQASFNGHNRQYTAPLPSPGTAASQYTLQQQQQQQQQNQQQQQLDQPISSSWLSDDIVCNLLAPLSDQTYMCLMQNCQQRFASIDDTKQHIRGHFAPQTVPLQQSQPLYQHQLQAQQSYPNFSNTRVQTDQTQLQYYPQQQQSAWI